MRTFRTTYLRSAARRTAAAWLLIAMAMAPAEGAHYSATWSGPNGNWSDASKWNTDDYPHNHEDDTYDATIGGGNVTLNVSAAVNNLTFSGGTLGGSANQLLSAVQTLTWTGGTFGGSAGAVSSAGLTLSGQLTLAGGRSLYNAGTGTFSGTDSKIEHNSTGFFWNQSGATFTIDGAGDYLGGTIRNAGSLVKQGAGVSEISATLEHTGTLDVLGGTLKLTGGGTYQGPVMCQPGAVLELANETHHLQSGPSIAGGGTVRVSGGTLDVIVPTLDLPGSLELTSGAIQGSGNVNITGLVTWSGGTMQGSGTTNVNGGLNLRGNLFLSNRRVLNIDSDATYTGDGKSFTADGDTTINNLLGNRFQVTGDSDLNIDTMNNRGWLIKQRGGGDGVTEIRGTFNNQKLGTVRVDANARLKLSSGGTHEGRFEGQGVLEFAATNHLEVGSRVETTSVEFRGSVTVDGDYDVVNTTIAAGINRFNSAAFTDKLVFTGGALEGTGSLTASGATTWTGGTIGGMVDVNANGGMSLSGSLGLEADCTLNNNGTATIANDVTFQNDAGAVLNNADGGRIELAGNANFSGGTLNNHGTLAKVLGTGLSEITATVNNLATGVVEVRTGTLQIKTGQHEGQFVAYKGARLEVNGDNTFDRSRIIVFDPGQEGAAVQRAAGDDTANVAFIGGTSLLDDGTTISGPGFTAVAGGTVNAGDDPADVVTAEQFAVDDGALAGSGTLEVTGQFRFAGGTMGGDGVTQLVGESVITGNPYLDGTRTVNNEGSAVFAGDDGKLHQQFLSSPLFYNLPAGTFTFAGDSDYLATTFHNQGTLIKQAGGDDGASVMSTMNNSGTVQVQSGTLSISAAGTHTGSFTGGGVLDLGGAQVLQPGSSVSVNVTRFSGNVTFGGTYGSPHTEITAGGTSFDVAASTQTLDLSGGYVSGSGSLDVTGVTTWTGGGTSGTGTLNARGGMDISGYVSLRDASTVNNAAVATYTGDFDSFDIRIPSVFNNLGTGRFTIAGDSDFGRWRGAFNNEGTLIKQAGGGDGVTFVGAALNNSGIVDVQSGKLRLEYGGTHTGRFTGSGTLEFANQGTNQLQAGSAVDVRSVLLSGGTTTIGGTYDVDETTITNFDHHFNSTAATDALTITGGTLHGNGTLSVSGLTTWTGGWMRGGGVTNANGGMQLEGWVYLFDGRTLNNAGVATFSGDLGGFWNGPGTKLNNLAGARFVFDGDSDYLAGTLNNHGTLVKRAGAGDGVTEIAAALNNTGSIDVQSGTLQLSGNLTNTGAIRVAPGSTFSVGGQLTMAAGSQYACRLGSAGVVDVAGQLDLRAPDDRLALDWNSTDATAKFGGDYVVATYGSRLGTFDTVGGGEGPYRIGELYVADVDYVTGDQITVSLHSLLDGDTDFDGMVGLDDWDAFRSNFGSSETDWTDGNFDPWSDGTVDLDDWDKFRANFGNAVPAAAAMNVPEPGTLVLLACAAASALAWRRRCHRRM